MHVDFLSKLTVLLSRILWSWSFCFVTISCCADWRIGSGSASVF